MKKIEEGLINEEIVRRYPGSDNNRGNNVVDIGKGGGPRSHDYGNVVAEELGDLSRVYAGSLSHISGIWFLEPYSQII